MRYWLALTVVAAWLQCGVSRGDVLELQTVTLQYQKVEGVARDPLFTGESVPNEYYALGVDLDVLGVIGIDSSLLAATDQTQFHYGGLEYFAYVRLLPNLSVGWSHESLHAFDTAFPSGYPLLNAVEVRLTIYALPAPRKSLF